MFTFAQSTCYHDLSDDVVNTRVMNVRLGGAQPAMRHNMSRNSSEDGGLKQCSEYTREILEERGINTVHIKGDDMQVVLTNHEDFCKATALVGQHF